MNVDFRSLHLAQPKFSKPIQSPETSFFSPWVCLLWLFRLFARPALRIPGNLPVHTDYTATLTSVPPAALSMRLLCVCPSGLRQGASPIFRNRLEKGQSANAGAALGH